MRDITVYVHMVPESDAGWSNYSANLFLAYSFFFRFLAYMSLIRHCFVFIRHWMIPTMA